MVAATLLAAAAVVTGCVVLFPQVRFGYRAPGGHTAAVVIALLVALLALGGFGGAALWVISCWRRRSPCWRR